MEPYELLDHTADAKFRAYGKTVEESFSNAVSAMTAIATDPKSMTITRTEDISISSEDFKSLLFDLLEEIIFLIDTQGFLPARAESLSISKTGQGYALKAILAGDDVAGYGCNLKAPTYSDMQVEQQEDGTWLIQAVVDI